MESSLFSIVCNMIILLVAICVFAKMILLIIKHEKEQEKKLQECTEVTFGKITESILIDSTSRNSQVSLYKIYCEFEVNGVVYNGRAKGRYYEKLVQSFTYSNVAIHYNKNNPRDFYVGEESVLEPTKAGLIVLIPFIFVECILVVALYKNIINLFKI